MIFLQDDIFWNLGTILRSQIKILVFILLISIYVNKLCCLNKFDINDKKSKKDKDFFPIIVIFV